MTRELIRSCHLPSHSPEPQILNICRIKIPTGITQVGLSNYSVNPPDQPVNCFVAGIARGFCCAAPKLGQSPPVRAVGTWLCVSNVPSRQAPGGWKQPARVPIDFSLQFFI